MMNELKVKLPYKEMLEKYEKEDTPILSRGLTLDIKSDILLEPNTTSK